MATVPVTREMAEPVAHETDWAEQDPLIDEDIAPAVASDPDAGPLLTDTVTAAALVRTERLRLGLSQTEFARCFRMPVGTLRDWEQNRRQPDATALAYLRVIAREPEAVLRALAA